jgi:hypothetical protein
MDEMKSDAKRPYSDTMSMKGHMKYIKERMTVPESRVNKDGDDALKNMKEEQAEMRQGRNMGEAGRKWKEHFGA